MKYRQMAKHFIYEAVSHLKVDGTDGNTVGEGKHFTPKQTEKLQKAVDEELARMKQKLIDKKIIAG